jgi:SAM-dependent methyltransferase/uncharacterized protein (DUF2062 family)
VDTRSPAARPTSIGARARALLTALRQEHRAPGRMFAACVVGAAVGATPLFGLHLPICIALATWLRLNRAAVYAAANISIPPLAPFLAFASIAVGSRVLHAPMPSIDAHALTHTPPWRLAGSLVARWMLGAPIVGGSIGLGLGVLAAVGLGERAASSDSEVRALDAAVLARFSKSPIARRQYVRWKLALDPVYRALVRALPPDARVLDVGCGLGIGALYAQLSGRAREVVGFDYDAAKIAVGREACRGLPITLTVDDPMAAGPGALEPFDAVCIIDVLHYLEADAARALVDRCVGALAADGTLILRETDRDARGAGWTSTIERWAIASGVNRGQQARYVSMATIAGWLAASGLTVERREVAGPLHPGNVLLIGRRAAHAERSAR